jgi:hypothetical protein
MSPDDFKLTAPPSGRDWLARGFGIRRCMCERCAPSTAGTAARPDISPTPQANHALSNAAINEPTHHEASLIARDL